MPVALEEILCSRHSGTPHVVGVLNLTPDSFSDGGRFVDPAEAIAQARRMAEEGAGIIDVGAESTRPGSARIGPEEQIARLKSVLPEVCRFGVLVSIDTTSSIVAGFAVDCGAAIINDISAGRDDAALLPLVARRGSAVVLMHMLGEPKGMQESPRYGDAVAEVKAFLAARLQAAREAGVPAQRCIIDPGIGFGKTVEHNLALLAGLPELAELGVPVMVGASRKRFIGAITGVSEPAGRLAGSLAAACAAYLGGATLLRVHDVAPTVQALEVIRRIRQARA